MGWDRAKRAVDRLTHATLYRAKAESTATSTADTALVGWPVKRPLRSIVCAPLLLLGTIWAAAHGSDASEHPAMEQPASVHSPRNPNPDDSVYQAVCKLKGRTAAGTAAAVVDRRIVVTSAHVTVDRETNEPYDGPYECVYAAGTPLAQSVRCALYERGSRSPYDESERSRDWAVLGCDPLISAPPLEFPSKKPDSKLAVGLHVRLPGYPGDVNGGQSISSDEDCNVKAFFTGYLNHDCVGGPGSSGAPLIADMTDAQNVVHHFIVGIHNRGPSIEPTSLVETCDGPSSCGEVYGGAVPDETFYDAVRRLEDEFVPKPRVYSGLKTPGGAPNAGVSPQTYRLEFRSTASDGARSVRVSCPEAIPCGARIAFAVDGAPQTITVVALFQPGNLLLRFDRAGYPLYVKGLPLAYVPLGEPAATRTTVVVTEPSPAAVRDVLNVPGRRPVLRGPVRSLATLSIEIYRE